MIGIFYIGEPRFKEIGMANHEKLFSKLRENWPIAVYDYTWNKAWPRNCPSDLAGVIQVWDFYKALNLVPEKYIIKMRTDVWLSDAAVDAIAKEMSMIVNDETHVIENKFNRAVFYSADLIHAGVGGFGNNQNDARLTLTVFMK